MTALPPRAILFAPAGEALAGAEKEFFARVNPLGFILFARNCRSRAQTAALTRDLRACVGRADAPVLMDMEGGRVARLAPPVWPAFPAAARFGRLYRQSPDTARAACFAAARLAGAELAALGIGWNAMPVLDMPAPGADPVIGDRAYGAQPAMVIALARAAAQGLMAAGVLPVIKHMPGHGRALCDSHRALPHIHASRRALQNHDFLPFAALADLPLAMMAHLVVHAYDPVRPASRSPALIERLVRGEMGFDGLLLSDAIEMEALSGTLAARAQAVLEAGCDVALHCSGVLAEMKAAAEGVRPLSPACLARLARAQKFVHPPAGFEPAPHRARLAAMAA